LRNPTSTRPWQHVLEPLSGYLNLILALEENPNLHGEAFNFGPSENKNFSVEDLVKEMSLSWDKVQWEVKAEKCFYPESNLLKLNCDKALNYLKWHSIWDFKRTISETVLWYKDFYQNQERSTFESTILQINSYTQSANKEGLLWAQQL
jgi:CDP-glucose 4,6-dehydratase